MDGTMDSNGVEEEENDDVRFWRYIKEGNSSFVIGHKKKHIVYQLWKQDAKDALEKNSRKEECWAKINYIKNCLQPALGSYSSIPKCISVSPHFIDSVSKAFESQRPLKRCHQVIDPYQTSVLCSPNFCFLDNIGQKGRSTLTIELKPKRGYILTHHLPSIEIEDQLVCLFCMQQILKRKRGVWDYTSKYCPIDLFSGVPERMRHALESLFKTPQNNLCIFKDGEIIYPREDKSLPSQDDQEDITMAIQSWFECEEGSLSSDNTRPHVPHTFSKSACIQDVISLVIQALCRSDNASTFQEITQGSSPWIPCLEGQQHGLNHDEEVSSCRLAKDCVLGRILTMQRMDTHGIHVIHKVYQRYMEHLSHYPEQKEGLRITDPCLTSCLTTNVKQRLSDDEISSLPIQECVSLLNAYMMSRTARDCSILITFKPADPSSTMDDDMVSLKEQRFHVACNLVDLDSKLTTKIPYYHKLEQLISETYSSR
ncbi:inositol-pentakisphosphate 2-kinase isoform X1 [Strongylocentrotus purpuratus]|uniref:Inositol-pentakisphosphate 2-kinase n=1 Tax=Strongylocentrotus purpuratus TaxID=7668 RepID=A0A7M7N150_STRPU|nr:inositol-pentakisphosphate 2-kinase isoform X1 [Strongylocentrotus purpuratus]XP_030829154.1 inositol-pentakisphosphate 2-kinase isoform X1 [Strongylocentrotus purpuratus]|eukprot:XP_003731799.1 PREDICTED: inositol-pentakisphosphate 2-kinase [Strongylocentrotus purpuratus]